MTVQERWEDKIIPEPNSGCWLWMGAVTNRGYGVLQVDGKLLYAHRVGYELHKGLIPEGLYIDHRCSVPLCVNPDHLDAVTPGENVVRTVERGRNSNQYVGISYCKRGHLLDDDSYVLPNGKGWRYCRACARLRRNESRRKKREGIT